MKLCYVANTLFFVHVMLYQSCIYCRTMFDGEFTSLNKMNETNTVCVPKPRKVFSKGSESYLVMEYLEMSSLSKYDERKLGANRPSSQMDVCLSWYFSNHFTRGLFANKIVKMHFVQV